MDNMRQCILLFMRAILNCKIPMPIGTFIAIFRICFITSLPLLLIACKTNNSENAAKDFCRCMSENDAKNNYRVAYEICQAKMITEYPLLRYYYVNMRYETISKEDSIIKRDALEFESKFRSYTVKYCCADVYGCQLLSDSTYIDYHLDIFPEKHYPLCKDSTEKMSKR